MGTFDHHLCFSHCHVSFLQLVFHKLPILCRHHVYPICTSSLNPLMCYGQMQFIFIPTVENRPNLQKSDRKNVSKHPKIRLSRQINPIHHWYFHHWIHDHVAPNFTLRIDPLETRRIPWVGKWCRDFRHSRGFSVCHQLFRQLFCVQIFGMVGEESEKTKVSISYWFVQRHEPNKPFIFCLKIFRKNTQALNFNKLILSIQNWPLQYYKSKELLHSRKEEVNGKAWLISYSDSQSVFCAVSKMMMIIIYVSVAAAEIDL